MAGYPVANSKLYSKRRVGYSIVPQDLGRLRVLLEEDGCEVRPVPRRAWASIDFVRDGSMLMLEDTLLVWKDGTFCGFVTPTKLISYRNLERIEGLYRSPITFGMLLYVAILIFTSISYWILRGV